MFALAMSIGETVEEREFLSHSLLSVFVATEESSPFNRQEMMYAVGCCYPKCALVSLASSETIFGSMVHDGACSLRYFSLGQIAPCKSLKFCGCLLTIASWRKYFSTSFLPVQ